MLGLSSGLAQASYMKDYSYALIEWDTNQTSNSGVRIVNPWSATREAGDTVSVTCNIYITGSGGTFDDGSDDVAIRMSQLVGDAAISQSLAQNTLHAIDVESGAQASGSWSNVFYVAWHNTPGDYPDAGAKIYISNLKIVLKGSGGAVKETILYNFSGAGDISDLEAFSVEGSLSITKGNALP